jgi:hypothetical protein
VRAGGARGFIQRSRDHRGGVTAGVNGRRYGLNAIEGGARLRAVV